MCLLCRVETKRLAKVNTCISQKVSKRRINFFETKIVFSKQGKDSNGLEYNLSGLFSRNKFTYTKTALTFFCEYISRFDKTLLYTRVPSILNSWFYFGECIRARMVLFLGGPCAIWGGGGDSPVSALSLKR